MKKQKGFGLVESLISLSLMGLFVTLNASYQAGERTANTKEMMVTSEATFINNIEAAVHLYITQSPGVRDTWGTNTYHDITLTDLHNSGLIETGFGSAQFGLDKSPMGISYAVKAFVNSDGISAVVYQNSPINPVILKSIGIDPVGVVIQKQKNILDLKKGINLYSLKQFKSANGIIDYKGGCTSIATGVNGLFSTDITTYVTPCSTASDNLLIGLVDFKGVPFSFRKSKRLNNVVKASTQFVPKTTAIQSALSFAQNAVNAVTPPPAITVKIPIIQDTVISGYNNVEKLTSFGIVPELFTWSSSVRRILIKTNISLPLTAKLKSAKLYLHVKNILYQRSPLLGVYGMTRAWQEGTTFLWGAAGTGSTWYEYDASVKNNWQHQGGDYDNVSNYGLGANGMLDKQFIFPNSWVAFDVTALVNQWVNHSAPNYGFMVFGLNQGNEVHIDSRESNNVNFRPYLEVTYK